MNMKQWRDRHIYIGPIEAAFFRLRRIGCDDCERLKNDLPVAEIDRFGQAGRTGGVESRRPGFLGKFRERELAGRLRKERLILFRAGRGTSRHGLSVRNQNDFFD